MNQSLFLTFEGIDGSGKSSLANQLADYFFQCNFPAVFTYEPTDSYLGKAIRDIVLYSKETISENQQILLFLADRTGHVLWIKEQMKLHKTVICDRFIHSTLAYQGKDKKTMKSINTIYRILNGSFFPDITFLIDIDPRIALKRIDDSKKDNFEKVEFLDEVRKRYLELARNSPKKFVVLDGTFTPVKLIQIIIATLKKRFNLLDRKER